MPTLEEEIVELLTYAFPHNERELRDFGERLARTFVRPIPTMPESPGATYWRITAWALESDDALERLLLALKRKSHARGLPELSARINWVRRLKGLPQWSEATPPPQSGIVGATAPGPGWVKKLGGWFGNEDSHAPNPTKRPAFSKVAIPPRPGAGAAAGPSGPPKQPAPPDNKTERRFGIPPGVGAHAPTLESKGLPPLVEQPTTQPSDAGVGDGDASDDAVAGDVAEADAGSGEETPLVPEQHVSIGVSSPDEPETPLSIDRTLAPATQHLLWVQISKEHAPGAVPGVAALTALREDDELDVVVFGFPDQLVLDGPRHGRIRLAAKGNQLVKLAWKEILPDSTRPRLYFAFTTPAAPGRYALRCHIYCRGVLLQSHLVRAQVARRVERHQGAVDRLLDYNLTSKLDPACIPADAACQLSLFLNDDGNDTHSFRFVSSENGVAETIADAHMEGAQLKEMVRYAREALRWTAWGTTKPWNKEPCKFTGGYDRQELGPALTLLARRGANLWMQLTERFAFVGPDAFALSEKMRAPGRVQIALKESPEAVIPAALIYDYPFDVATEERDVKLCEASLAAIAAGRALESEPCFRGQCPSHGDLSVVCAGGFWGFRHELGLPLHLPRGEVASKIARTESVRAFAPISTDVNFVIRDGHLAQLAGLSSDWLEVLRSRDACLARLKEPRQLVYFYCHGGVKEETNTPFLQVGDVNSSPIFAQSLFTAKIFWKEPVRPLVILNGCHTTATSPDAMFSMLTGFAAHCNAAGIIGTEITNFEFVASEFGRQFLSRFLVGESVGSAVRMARLELLRKGNPLGLMYIPFALPSLRLE